MYVFLEVGNEFFTFLIFFNSEELCWLWFFMLFLGPRANAELEIMFFAALHTYYRALSKVNLQFRHKAALPKLIPKSIRSTDKTLPKFYLIFQN
jgi:hypothetical protein